jgi:hypothetical protein
MSISDEPLRIYQRTEGPGSSGYDAGAFWHARFERRLACCHRVDRVVDFGAVDAAVDQMFDDAECDHWRRTRSRAGEIVHASI